MSLCAHCYGEELTAVGTFNYKSGCPALGAPMFGAEVQVKVIAAMLQKHAQKHSPGQRSWCDDMAIDLYSMGLRVGIDHPAAPREPLPGPDRPAAGAP